MATSNASAPSSEGLETGIDRLALQSQNAKNTLMHTAQRFGPNKAFKRLDTEREFPERE